MEKRLKLFFAVLFMIIFSREISGDTQLNNKVIIENTVWSGDIIVLGFATVERNIVLTISPGTVVKFITPDGALNIKGTLLANGTYDKKITFTSYYDSASSEKWEGIKFSGEKNENNPNQLSHCIIKFAAIGIKCFEAATVNIENCTFTKNNLAVNYLQTSNGFINHNEFIENMDGGIVCEQVKLKINNNYFINNTNFAIICAKKSEVDIEDNLITKSQYGVRFSLVGTTGTIKNNIIQENKFGIFAEMLPEPIISNNTLRNNEYGIYLVRGPKPNITMNEITENSIGVFIWQNVDLNINDNNIYNNKEYEIGLKEVSSDMIKKLKQAFKTKEDKKKVFRCMSDGLDAPEETLTDYIDARRNFWGEEVTKEMKAKGGKANIIKILDFYDNPEVRGEDGNMYQEKYFLYDEWKETAIEGAGAKKKPSYGLNISK